MVNIEIVSKSIFKRNVQIKNWKEKYNIFIYINNKQYYQKSLITKNVMEQKQRNDKRMCKNRYHSKDGEEKSLIYYEIKRGKDYMICIKFTHRTVERWKRKEEKILIKSLKTICLKIYFMF